MSKFETALEIQMALRKVTLESVATILSDETLEGKRSKTMREIKFRAWDKKNEKYFEEEYDDNYFWIKGTDGSVADLLGFEIMDWSQDEFELEQFTGLHDKKGKEIYEGDIAEWLDYETKRIGYVNFGPDIKFITSNHSFSFGNFAYQDTEKHLIVIGNIHKNPELLEGARDGKGLNDLQKFYWTTKKNDDYGNAMHLKRDPSGSIERVPYSFRGENERLTEQEIIDEGYNPDYYVKEDVKR